ncbi:MAG: hypothetical protein ACUVTZ_06600 [Armatimonadota bacterium]
MSEVLLQASDMASNLFPLLAMGAVFWLVFRNPVCRLPKRADAERRAEALLRQMLTEEEYRQLATQGYLKVSSPTVPNRVYLIPRYRGLVRVHESGKPVMRLCIGPVEPVPDADVVLMHKFMIEGNEEEYLKAANIF